MKTIVRDRKIMRLLWELQSYNLRELAESQLIAFKEILLETEQACKWYDTSCKCNNLIRAIDRELDFRFENMKWWGLAS